LSKYGDRFLRKSYGGNSKNSEEDHKAEKCDLKFISINNLTVVMCSIKLSYCQITMKFWLHSDI